MSKCVTPGSDLEGYKRRRGLQMSNAASRHVSKRRKGTRAERRRKAIADHAQF